MMGEILNKLGIYDLVAVLLSGISIATFSIFALQFVYEIPIDINLHVKETLVFLVCSYFLGLIFQELGSFLHKKIIYRNNKLLKKTLKISENSYVLLTEKEKNGVYFYVKQKLNLEDYNDNLIYNYCKYYVLENCDTTRIDKDQSLSAMSRSLSLYFLILSLIALVTLFLGVNFPKMMLLFLSMFFSILLYFRGIRFAKLRYVYILRTFYYKEVVK